VPERRHPRHKKVRTAQGENYLAPLWIRISFGVIVLMALVGTVIKFVERRGRPKTDPPQTADATPARPAPAPEPPPPDTAPAKKPPETAPPKRVRITTREPAPPAEPLIATITAVRGVEPQVEGIPFDLLVEYEYTDAALKRSTDSVVFTTASTNGAQLVDGTAAKATNRFSARVGDSFPGETRFWIERHEGGKFWRISNIYVLRR
jgi:hypothetical protein